MYKKLIIILMLFESTILFAGSNTEKDFVNRLMPHVSNGKKVYIVVVDKDDPQSIVYEIENLLIDEFGKYPNFKIVDRVTLNSVLAEFKFQTMGLVNDKDLLKIGELSGATYIVIKNLSDDKLNYIYRLIHILSGDVIYNMVVKNKKEKEPLNISFPKIGLTLKDSFIGLGGYFGWKSENTKEEVWDSYYEEYETTTVEVDHSLYGVVLEAGVPIGQSIAISGLIGLGLYSTSTIDDYSYDYYDESHSGLLFGGRGYLYFNNALFRLYGELLIFNGVKKIYIPGMGVVVEYWTLGAGLSEGMILFQIGINLNAAYKYF